MNPPEEAFQMRMLGRTSTVLGLACLVQVPALMAQTTGFETFKWYVGAQAGITIFETPTQTRGGIFSAGAHLLVTAKRTGLLLSVEEGIKRNQTSSFADASAAGGVRQVVFNDLRKYSASLLAFPFRTFVQPYVGLGIGFLQTVKEYPSGTTPATAPAAQALAESAGSIGFGTAIGGVQARVDRFVVFGQYQFTTAAASGKLLVGPTHTFSAGMRISLGNAREGVAGAGTGSD
jgi:hypothetical protein